MPIYEYRCASCGHQQEFLQKVSDAPLTVCTQCGKTAFSKMVTAAGFQLKGSGWYATDFKNSGAKPAATSAESSSKSGEAASKSGESSSKPGESSSTDAKPAGESKSNGEKKATTPPASAGGSSC